MRKTQTSKRFKLNLARVRTLFVLIALAVMFAMSVPAKAELGFVCKASDDKYGNCSYCNPVYPRGNDLVVDYYLCPTASSETACCPKSARFMRNMPHRQMASEAVRTQLGGLR